MDDFFSLRVPLRVGRPALYCLFLFACLLHPATTHAKTSTLWDFRDAASIQTWQGDAGIQAAIVEEGFAIRTTNTAGISTPLNRTRYDALKITYASQRDTNINIAWPKEPGSQEQFIATIFLPRSSRPQTIAHDLTHYREWKGSASKLGIVFEPGTEITLQSVELVSFNLFEKLGSALMSFWSFDRIRPSSINFLWGPRVASNPILRDTMWLSAKPYGMSGMWFVYIVIGCGCGLVLWKRGKIQQRVFLKSCCMLLAACWILLDLRMGAELISYARSDRDRYIYRDVGHRLFRERGMFGDFAKNVDAIVQDGQDYVFLADQRWPYLGLMRYETYPSIPVHFDRDLSEIDIWAVYQRSDIGITDQNEIVLGDTVVSAPGQVTDVFDHDAFTAPTFLFSTK